VLRPDKNRTNSSWRRFDGQWDPKFTGF